MRKTRQIDPARRVAFLTLEQVSEGGYANLVLPQQIRSAKLDRQDAAFTTELVNGTCRFVGTYDLIIEAASSRDLNSIDLGILNVLRLGAHQLFAMRVPDHAAVATSVDLAGTEVGDRSVKFVNAVMRKMSSRDLQMWVDQLTSEEDVFGKLAVSTGHPRWIVESYAKSLPEDELEIALRANNIAPTTDLVIRPGLITVAELIAAGAEPEDVAQYGAHWKGDPSLAPGVSSGKVGVQDFGSQLVTQAFAAAAPKSGTWLDLCAGPGGKTALLAGLVTGTQVTLEANEVNENRAHLVAKSVRAYPNPPHIHQQDGRTIHISKPVSAVLADVPCSGLGALRRRPDARWVKQESDVIDLGILQRELLLHSLDLVEPGGIVGYITCSPDHRETHDIVNQIVAERPDITQIPAAPFFPQLSNIGDQKAVQLWPHRHGTDAMFIALLQKDGES